MEVKPVKQTEKPNYPLKDEIKEEELKRQIPKRWMQSPAAKIALGTLAAVTLAGCAPEMTDGLIISVTPSTEASVSATPTNTQVMINVAPLFKHGKGVGSFGCIMVAPPAFMSEYEALTVINEAAQEYGLYFSAKDTPEFANVLQPVTSLNSHLPPADSAAPAEAADMPATMITLRADFSDNGHGIAIEFISKEDVKQWSRDEARASVEIYKTLDAAAQLSEALESATPGDYGSYNIAVLYDPCVYIDPDPYSDNSQEQKDAREKLRKMSREQLKAQAKDFFEWLKSQGVI